MTNNCKVKLTLKDAVLYCEFNSKMELVIKRMDFGDAEKDETPILRN